MRLLITGASGFLGARLIESLAAAHEVAGTGHAKAGGVLLPLDVTSEASIDGLLDERRPEAVLNCAALADPDACEREPDRARAVNAAGAGRLARGCARRGIRLVHVSTDLVFDGARGGYSEEDAPAPLSVYGRAKLEGEREVLVADPSAAVVRVSLVYGRARAGRPSFLDWLLAELTAGRRPRLFTDQWRTPTAMAQLPGVLERVAALPLSGVFHWGGGERVSRFQFGQAACRAFGFPEDRLEPAKLADFGYAAARPADCSLLSERLARALGMKPWGLEEGLSAER